jgi:hypothetical protein
MKCVIFVLILFALSGCNTNIPEDVNLEWQYEHSTDVAHFKVINFVPIQLENQVCDSIVWELEASQVFKGSMNKGDVIQVWGPNDPNYWKVGSDRLMFLRMYDGEPYSVCSKHLFSNFKQVHWGCCEITGAGDDAQVQFGTMLNSEESGPNIPVDADIVFSRLRSYEQKQP